MGVKLDSGWPAAAPVGAEAAAAVVVGGAQIQLASIMLDQACSPDDDVTLVS